MMDLAQHLMYHLCLKTWEIVKHLMAKCSYTKGVWARIKRALNFTFVWDGSTVTDCFESWNKQDFMYPSLPAFIHRYVWLGCNKFIFENGSPTIQSVVYRSLGGVGGDNKKVKIQTVDIKVVAGGIYLRI
jgi:hypothetical protein